MRGAGSLGGLVAGTSGERGGYEESAGYPGHEHLLMRVVWVARPMPWIERAADIGPWF